MRFACHLKSFTVKDAYDYQGRSFLHIPQDTGLNLKSTDPPDKYAAVFTVVLLNKLSLGYPYNMTLYVVPTIAYELCNIFSAGVLFRKLTSIPGQDIRKASQPSAGSRCQRTCCSPVAWTPKSRQE